MEFRSSVAMNASLFGYFIITYLWQIIFQGSRPSYKDLAKTKLSSVSLSCVLSAIDVRALIIRSD